jgi:diguanylate cyclase (GGDEF)-like protein
MQMRSASLPSGEAAPRVVPRSDEPLDGANQAALDELVHLAARLTGRPMALVSLLDSDRVRFKARFGVELREMTRKAAPCAHAMLTPGSPLVLSDVLADARFAESPLVTDAPRIRSYAGIPLVTAEGHTLGTLCVMDRVPRDTGEEALGLLRDLARAVVANLDLRAAARLLGSTAHTDDLTGLANRTALRAALAELAGANAPMAVILVELESCRRASDALGLAAGDALLRVAGERLRGVLRPHDILGRLGGERFAALVPGVATPGEAATIATRMQQALATPVRLAERALPLVASFGIARITATADSPDLALQLAEEGLSRAKRAGGGGIGWAGPHEASRLRRAAAILRDFADGCGPLRASLMLQPMLTLGPGMPRLRGLEALARWRHPKLGEVPADELFAIVGPDDADSMAEQVRRSALATIAALRADGFAVPRLAVNLSASELARPDICQRIADEIGAEGLSPACIEIELAEGVLLDRVSDRTLDGLAALRADGARLILDDFGTGNSGLAQLLRLPLDALKLDRRFIVGMATDSRAAEIVKATTGLARGLGLEVIAKGVESARDAALAHEYGCHAAQGFFFARSIPPTALRAWLRGRPDARADVPGGRAAAA